MIDEESRYVNQCAINELIDYSLNVQECEDRATEIRETIAQRRIQGIEDKDFELKLWRDEGIEIHNTYILYSQFGRQKCVPEHLNEKTLEKLALDLAEAHKGVIDKLIKVAL
jgi:hypothetical protein